MGQYCYLEAGDGELMDREIPWAWCILTGTPGTLLSANARTAPQSGYELRYQIDLERARIHYINTFEAIDSFLWDACDNEWTAKAEGFRRLFERYPAGSVGWNAIRLALCRFDPSSHLNVLKLLAKAPASCRHLTLDANELVSYGIDEDRPRRLSILQQATLSSVILTALGQLDIAKLIRATSIAQELFPASDLEDDDATVLAWLRMTFYCSEDCSKISEYLFAERLWEFNSLLDW